MRPGTTALLAVQKTEKSSAGGYRRPKKQMIYSTNSTLTLTNETSMPGLNPHWLTTWLMVLRAEELHNTNLHDSWACGKRPQHVQQSALGSRCKLREGGACLNGHCCGERSPCFRDYCYHPCCMVQNSTESFCSLYATVYEVTLLKAYKRARHVVLGNWRH